MAIHHEAEDDMDHDSSETKHDTEPAVPIIEAGHARHAMLAALANLAHSVAEVEAVGMAIARTLDDVTEIVRRT